MKSFTETYQEAIEKRKQAFGAIDLIMPDDGLPDLPADLTLEGLLNRDKEIIKSQINNYNEYNTFTWAGAPGKTFTLPAYMPTPVYEKGIWLREEINIADELMELAPKLTEEFLAFHDDFIDGDFTKGAPYVNETFDTSLVQNRSEAWKVDSLKYTYKEKKILNEYFKTDKRNRFPTAAYLTEKYGDDCPCSSYSILDKDSIIYRHTGIENRDNEFIRIHIPLIVPEGDIFFEVEGTEVDWQDLFGFDNQCIHSAYNHTQHRRLVYLLDIHRSVLDIPIGRPYDIHREMLAPPFVRGAKPKLLHNKQRI
jgi:hypothetical protein